jgi:hypothetical protein
VPAGHEVQVTDDVRPVVPENVPTGHGINTHAPFELYIPGGQGITLGGNSTHLPNPSFSNPVGHLEISQVPFLLSSVPLGHFIGLHFPFLSSCNGGQVNGLHTPSTSYLVFVGQNKGVFIAIH